MGAPGSDSPFESGAAAVVEGVGDHGCEYMTGGTVIVLGTTGRNFAAGMSGGYRLRLRRGRAVRRRCNLEMVELEAMAPRDSESVRALLEEHVRRTGSPKASELLGAWDAVVPKFVKVVPSEYRRALEAQASPATNGIPPSRLPPAMPYVSTGRYMPRAPGLP